MALKIITWNVNGLRAVLKKNFKQFLHDYSPDILCLQETKLRNDLKVNIEEFPYNYFHNSAVKLGYSGTAILSQKEPIKIRCIDVDQQYPEGRILLAEYEHFYIISVYVPNSQDELKRLTYRTKIWDLAFRQLLINLQQTKPVIVGGDFNVAHEAIDLERPESNHFNPGFTDAERAEFSKHLQAGLLDVYRKLHPNLAHKYTWWSYRAQARAKNVGWRIDYFLVSESLFPKILSCKILQEVEGSDHAPVQLEVDF